ncbi:Ion transport domain-containing protein, partial [Pavlovales sp. CCMP2436]
CWLLDRSTAWTSLVNLSVCINTLVLILDAPYAWYAADQPLLVGLSATTELYFTVAFTLEMCVRVVAVGPVRYLRSLWSWLDVLVVALGWAEFILTLLPQAGSNGNFSVLRSFRILRAMRATRTLPQLQHIIQCLFIAVLDLGNVVLLLAMVFLVFGLVGIILFSGKFHFQCVDDRSGLVLDGVQRCSSDLMVGYQCVPHATCTDVGDNPNNNLTSFDNIGYAFLTIFQCVTGEGWAAVMYLVMDTVGEVSSLYFVALTTFATWFCINLLVAVL